MTAATPSSPGSSLPAALDAAQRALLTGVEAKARAAAVFGEITLSHPPGDGGGAGSGEMLVCAARNSAARAEYRLFLEKGQWWIALITPDRWLSESVESAMLEGRDKIEDLIEEELVELGLERRVGKVEHFRSAPPQKLYTFRFQVPAPGSARAAADETATFLLATEAAFRQLGDMDSGSANAAE